jgi:hypothetical protein
MRSRQAQILMLVLSVALVLSAAGCGKKKSITATRTITTTEVTTTAAATTTTAAATTTSAATTTTAAGTTTASSGLGALGALGSSANCRQLATLSQSMSKAFQGAGGDLQKQAKLMKEFADNAPSGIKADFETYAAFFQKVADVYGNYKPGTTPDAATIAKLSQLSTSVDMTKLTAAAQHIAAWATQNCHA